MWRGKDKQEWMWCGTKDSVVTALGMRAGQPAVDGERDERKRRRWSQSTTKTLQLERKARGERGASFVGED